MIKRVRNHLVRKPVEEIPETESYQSTSPERGQHDASAQSSRASPSLGGTPQPTPRRLESVHS